MNLESGAFHSVTIMMKSYWLAPPQNPGLPEFSSSNPDGSKRRSRRNKKFVIRLTPSQREELDRILTSKTCSHRDHVRAQAMLLADELNPSGAKTDEQIAKLTHLSVRTIETVRRRFVEQGLVSAVSWRRVGPNHLPPPESGG
jgi:hypothetical protein